MQRCCSLEASQFQPEITPDRQSAFRSTLLIDMDNKPLVTNAKSPWTKGLFAQAISPLSSAAVSRSGRHREQRSLSGEQSSYIMKINAWSIYLSKGAISAPCQLHPTMQPPGSSKWFSSPTEQPGDVVQLFPVLGVRSLLQRAVQMSGPCSMIPQYSFSNNCLCFRYAVLCRHD